MRVRYPHSVPLLLLLLLLQLQVKIEYNIVAEKCFVLPIKDVTFHIGAITRVSDVLL